MCIRFFVFFFFVNVLKLNLHILVFAVTVSDHKPCAHVLPLCVRVCLPPKLSQDQSKLTALCLRRRVDQT